MKYYLFLSVSACLLLAGSCSHTRVRPKPPEPGYGFSVVSSNLLVSNTKREEATRNLLDSGCDIIVLVELTRWNFDMELARKVGYTYGIVHYDDIHPGNGIAILSKLPGEAAITRDEPFFRFTESPNPRLPMATMRITLKEEPIGIVGVHLPVPLFVSEEYRQSYSDYLTGKIGDGRLTSPLGSLKRGDRLVICGDFNALDGDHIMRRYNDAGLKNAAIPAYSEPTWNIFRIDHILTESGITPIWYDTFNVNGSDHRAISAVLKASSPPPAPADNSAS